MNVEETFSHWCISSLHIPTLNTNDPCSTERFFQGMKGNYPVHLPGYSEGLVTVSQIALADCICPQVTLVLHIFTAPGPLKKECVKYGRGFLSSTNYAKKIMNLPDTLKKIMQWYGKHFLLHFPRNRRGKKTTLLLSLGQAYEANLFENLLNLQIYICLK